MEFFRDKKIQISSTESELKDQELLAALRSAEYVNKGQDAIVLKVKIPMLQMDGTEFVAAKLLKIYTNGRESHHEARIQKMAYEIIETAAQERPNVYARIPKPLDVRTVVLDEQTKNAIQHITNTQLRVTAVDIEFMEYISDSVELLEHLRTVAQQMFVLQGEDPIVYNPGRFSHHTDDNPERKRRDYIESFVKKLVSMSTDTHILDPRILSQIKETVVLLHKHGVYHRDLHERNVLVRHIGEVPDVYIIDFGKSTVVDTSNRDVYQTDEGLHDDDFTLIYRYNELTQSSRATEAQKNKKFMRDIQALRTRIESKKGNASLVPLVESIKNLVRSNDVIAVHTITTEAKKIFGTQAGKDDLARMVCVAVLVLLENHEISISELPIIETHCVQMEYTPSIMQKIYQLNQ